MGDVTAGHVVRKVLRRWLSEYDWPLDVADDLILAVSEAVSNAVEHGYGDTRLPAGKITVRAEQVINRDVRCLVVTVIDHGHWRPVPVETENRRRGIPMMRAVMASVDINGSAVGTRVTMTSRPVPLSGASAQRRRDDWW
jgi:anti-sigma regulatory factor (Ser/Thr protein kinase)